MTAGAAPVAEPGRIKAADPVQVSRPATVVALPTDRRAAGTDHVRARAPGGRRTRGGPVVLTRRGRIVVTAALALVAAGVFLVLARGAAATGVGVPAVRSAQNLSQVAVRPGDTLWSIAVRADRSADPRLVVQRITDLNALPGAGITPGQILWVPRN